MDSRLNGLLSQYVLVMMLLKVSVYPASAASVSVGCAANLSRTEKLTNLLRDDTNKLFALYEEKLGFYGNSTPEGIIPDSTISGINFTEKLKDICIKDRLFFLHLSLVDEYQKMFLEEEPLKGNMTDVKKRLEHLLAWVKQIVKFLDPNTPLATPASLQKPNNDDFNKKNYGWHVIHRLEKWLSQVLLVFKEGKKVCQNLPAGTRRF